MTSCLMIQITQLIEYMAIPNHILAILNMNTKLHQPMVPLSAPLDFCSMTNKTDLQVA